MTSDRGLCAAFNSNIMRAAREFYKELKAREVEIEFIVHGKKAQGALKYAGLPVAKNGKGKLSIHPIFRPHG